MKKMLNKLCSNTTVIAKCYGTANIFKNKVFKSMFIIIIDSYYYFNPHNDHDYITNISQHKSQVGFMPKRINFTQKFGFCTAHIWKVPNNS